MSADQMASRNLLLKTANLRNGAIPEVTNKKAQFQQSSITNFRKKMLEEEKASENTNM